MIVKRPMKFEMRNLKRCKIDEPDAESGACLSSRSKILKTNGHCSVEKGSALGSFCGSDESKLGSQVDAGAKKSNCRNELNGSIERPTPPLLTYSRNRSKKLLPRLNDSVVRVSDNGQAKECTASSIGDADHKVEHEERPGTERGCMEQADDDKGRLNCEIVRSREQCSRAEVDKHLRIENSEALTEVKVTCTVLDNFDFRRQLSSLSPLVCSVNSSPSIDSVGYVPGFSHEGTEQWRNGDTEKKREIYKPEDFTVGDIVWGKCGKKYPAWPAIVIDPWVNAPDSVLRCCVPGALCVMFFGYSKNGTQRVRSCSKLNGRTTFLASHIFCSLSFLY